MLLDLVAVMLASFVSFFVVLARGLLAAVLAIVSFALAAAVLGFLFLATLMLLGCALKGDRRLLIEGLESLVVAGFLFSAIPTIAFVHETFIGAIRSRLRLRVSRSKLSLRQPDAPFDEVG